MAINFLHVNGKNYSVIICFSKTSTTIPISKKLMRMGRKSCLFMYYVELIDSKLWMVEEVVTLNGGLKSRMVEGMIRRKIWKQCK